MTTPTAARPIARKSFHWYTPAGEAAYEQPKKDGKGMTQTTVVHARKLNLLPSVTTILTLLHKEALVNWKIEQACLAIITSARLPDEKEDDFIYRVLHTEQQQDEEARIARDKGTLIHDAMEAYFQGQPVADDILPFIEPAFKHIWAQGEMVSTELIIVGEGYAGMIDLLQDCGQFWKLSDYKATKNLPEKAPWPEHRLQLAAYAQAFKEKLILAGEPIKPIKAAIVYISTVEPGKFVEHEHGDWENVYAYGFAPLVIHWQWANNHVPKQEGRDKLYEEAGLPVETVAVPPATKAQLPAQAAPPVTTPDVPAASLPETKGGKHVQWTPGVRLS